MAGKERCETKNTNYAQAETFIKSMLSILNIESIIG